MGSVKNSTPNKQWSADLYVDKVKVNFKIDTGADLDIISDKIYRELFNHKPLFQSTKKLKGPDCKLLPILGYIKCSMLKGNKTCQSDVYIMKGGTPLLGRDSSVALEVVALINDVDNYPQLFRGLGEMKSAYKIELQANAQPFAVQYPRRIAIPLLPKVKIELDRLETLGVIKRVTEPTDWCAPIVVVPKPNDKVRLCVDDTHLNQAVKRERHQLPTVESVLAQMAGATVF